MRWEQAKIRANPGLMSSCWRLLPPHPTHPSQRKQPPHIWKPPDVRRLFPQATTSPLPSNPLFCFTKFTRNLAKRSLPYSCGDTRALVYSTAFSRVIKLVSPTQWVRFRRRLRCCMKWSFPTVNSSCLAAFQRVPNSLFHLQVNEPLVLIVSFWLISKIPCWREVGVSTFLSACFLFLVLLCLFSFLYSDGPISKVATKSAI